MKYERKTKIEGNNAIIVNRNESNKWKKMDGNKGLRKRSLLYRRVAYLIGMLACESTCLTHLHRSYIACAVTEFSAPVYVKAPQFPISRRHGLLCLLAVAASVAFITSCERHRHKCATFHINHTNIYYYYYY